MKFSILLARLCLFPVCFNILIMKEAQEESRMTFHEKSYCLTFHLETLKHEKFINAALKLFLNDIAGF